MLYYAYLNILRIEVQFIFMTRKITPAKPVFYNTENIYALITAAGLSSRMKQFKPLLPFKNGTLIESTLRNFLDAGISNLIVVVGHQKERLIPVLHPYPVKIVVNEAYADSDMFTSVKLGFNALPDSAKAVFLCPGDIPLISPDTIRILYETMNQNPALSCLIPSIHNRKGHPPIFSKTAMEQIRNYHGDCGVKGAMQNFADSTEYLEVTDEGILKDVDYPEDYQKLKRGFRV